MKLETKKIYVFMRSNKREKGNESEKERDGLIPRLRQQQGIQS